MLIGFWFGHALYKTPLPSKIDKEIKCLSMESDWKDTAPFVDKVFYSSVLDTCIAAERIANGWEPIYELMDMISRRSLWTFDKEKDGDDYYKKYLYAIKELE